MIDPYYIDDYPLPPRKKKTHFTCRRCKKIFPLRKKGSNRLNLAIEGTCIPCDKFVRFA